MGRLARFVALVVVAGMTSPAATAAERGANQLLRVIAPAHRERVGAHPFVNVVVGFGVTEQGFSADPASFRARLGRVDLTRLFRPVVDERGRVIGMRAEVGPALLRTGRAWNRIKLEVRSGASPKGRVLRDVDKIRFRAEETENVPPEVRLVSEAVVILPGQAVEFDASQSTDAEGDELSYSWDFGDGVTATGARVSHVFPDVPGDVSVRLTVSDGQADVPAEATLFAEPAICPTCTRGVLRVEGTERLEFGAVPVGASASKTITIRNADVVVTSQLAAVLGVEGEGFMVEPGEVTLGPGERADVTVTFAPGREGHHGGELAAVASASNQRFVQLLAHGYGGSAPGTGPLPVAEPAFYNLIGGGTKGIFPSGARFDANTAVRLCRLTGGVSSLDYCLTDADCAANGGTCPQAGVCLRGERAGQPCASTDECPGSFCDADVFFEPVDMCGDGRGGLFLMSEEGTFSDPLQTRETVLSATLARAEFDANGQRTAFELLTRVNEFTSQVACDGVPAGAGGRVYWAQYHNVLSTGDCFRDGREALTAMRKTGGSQSVLMPRIDAATGLPECEDIEEATDLQMTRDASTVYVSLSLGLYRARPSPLLMTPDVDDVFQVHPDGSVVVATVTDRGATGIVRLYKISPDQAVHGAPRLRDLAPCATITLPNNRATGTTTGATRLASFAVAPVAPGSFDATILVSVIGTGGSQGPVLPSELRVRALYAVASPAASSQCTVVGLVGLDALEQLTF